MFVRSVKENDVKNGKETTQIELTNNFVGELQMILNTEKRHYVLNESIELKIGSVIWNERGKVQRDGIMKILK